MTLTAIFFPVAIVGILSGIEVGPFDLFSADTARCNLNGALHQCNDQLALVICGTAHVRLRIGGGTRLKILEAFAAGLPVVSTAVGCEGLRVVDREHLVVADRAGFAGALIAALRDPAAGAERAARARALARDCYDWRMVGVTACASIERLWATGPAIACS